MNLSETKMQLILKLLESDSGNANPAQAVSPFLGQRVMVRTYSAGVHFGTLKSKVGQNVILENAHRVHYWAAACSLSQLAMEGDKKIDEARISMAVSSIELDQAIEVIPLGNGVFEQLTDKIWKK